MPFPRHLSIVAIGFTLIFFLKTPAALASAEFDVEAKATYTVNQSETTAVTHEISLKNRLQNVYATEYAISIGSTRIKNVWAKDGMGYLEPKIHSNPNSTTIQFAFKEKVVGLGQTLNFSVGYEDSDVTSKVGRVWEINIPQPDNLNEYLSYSIALIVPPQFTAPVQITPQPTRVTSNPDGTSYYFTEKGLQSRGVTALFGDQQVFAFDLRYTLENKSPIPKTSAIAIPPDTSNQRLIYETITPPPQTLQADQDGNWLATYTLKADERLEIHAVGQAILFLTPQEWGDRQAPLEQYLTPQDAWQVDDPSIQELAQKLKTPENIYNYVVSTLAYNYQRVAEGARRLGAKAALENPTQATCMEFTDLFISLARAANIPARELNGFAYSQNPNLRPLSLRQDILHAWPEYFDREKGRFIPVDPTWENTTQGIDYFSRFDLNHLVFAIHGISSETPYPAGFYKISASEEKDLIINPSSEVPKINTSVDVKLQLPKQSFGGIVTKGRLIISNVGNAALHETPILLDSQGFDILNTKPGQIALLLPYATETLSIRLRSRDWFTPTQGKLKVTVGEQTQEIQLAFEPIYKELLKYALVLALGTTIAKASTSTGSLLLSLAKRKGALRRQGEKP